MNVQENKTSNPDKRLPPPTLGSDWKRHFSDTLPTEPSQNGSAITPALTATSSSAIASGTPQWAGQPSNDGMVENGEHLSLPLRPLVGSAVSVAFEGGIFDGKVFEAGFYDGKIAAVSEGVVPGTFKIGVIFDDGSYEECNYPSVDVKLKAAREGGRNPASSCSWSTNSLASVPLPSKSPHAHEDYSLCPFAATLLPISSPRRSDQSSNSISPLPPTRLLSSCALSLRGTYSLDTGSSIVFIDGVWAMSYDSLDDPEKTHSFHFKMQGADTSLPPDIPQSGTYNGFFTLNGVDEIWDEVRLVFVRNSEGSYNVEGRGFNPFGHYIIAGIFKNGTFTINRFYDELDEHAADEKDEECSEEPREYEYSSDEDDDEDFKLDAYGKEPSEYVSKKKKNASFNTSEAISSVNSRARRHDKSRDSRKRKLKDLSIPLVEEELDIMDRNRLVPDNFSWRQPDADFQGSNAAEVNAFLHGEERCKVFRHFDSSRHAKNWAKKYFNGGHGQGSGYSAIAVAGPGASVTVTKESAASAKKKANATRTVSVKVKIGEEFVAKENLVAELPIKSEKWKKPHTVGKDYDEWINGMIPVVERAKAIVNDRRYNVVFDMLLAVGASRSQILEAADIISTHKNDLASATVLLRTMLSDKDEDIVPFNLLILWAIVIIVESGVHFEVDGDIHSNLVLPDNPEAVAKGIVSGDKLFRRKAGKSIEASFGEGSANLGQPLKLTVALQILQHWGCKGHKAQPDCPHNKIDDSPCNREILVVTPTWLLCDKAGIKYDRDAVTLPDLGKLMRLSDYHCFLIDKEEREKANSERKTKPPTDVRGQAKRFVDTAGTNLNAMPLLPLLMIIQQCVVTKLMGNDGQLATLSYEVTRAQDCTPEMRNSLVHKHGPLVHAQSITAAGKQLGKFEDDHLRFMEAQIVNVYSKVLGLPPAFVTNMLMKRSGRSNMTDVQKQLIRENSTIKQWLDNATSKQLSDKAKKGAETLGRAGRVKRAETAAETKRKKNPVYNHFTETESGWSCNYCPSVIKATQALRKHLLCSCKSCPLKVKNTLKDTKMYKRRS